MSKALRPKMTLEASVEKLDRLLWQKAIHSWQKLPPSVKSWMDPEDLYQEAAFAAIRCYDKVDDRGSFMTLAYISIDNRLKSRASFWTNPKRFNTNMTEIENVELKEERNFLDPFVDSVIANWVTAVSN